MQIQGSSIDDILRSVYTALRDEGDSATASKGSFSELRGVTLRLSDPRSRLSRSFDRGRVFSCLGEFAWYLSGSDETDFIASYIPRYRDADENGSISSAYGPRLMGTGRNDQLRRVISLLREKPTSRRAVIQLFDRTDLMMESPEVPCTCSIQFLCRDNKVHAFVTMRSNDAYFGLPHDIFAFTMLQELVARSLGFELGEYVHFAGSLHLYDTQSEKAFRFLAEGFQKTEAMPAMPEGEPWPSLLNFLQQEALIRDGGSLPPTEPSGGYWDDLARLLVAYRLEAAGDLAELRKTLHNQFFELYVKEREFKVTGSS